MRIVMYMSTLSRPLEPFQPPKPSRGSCRVDVTSDKVDAAMRRVDASSGQIELPESAVWSENYGVDK